MAFKDAIIDYKCHALALDNDRINHIEIPQFKSLKSRIMINVHSDGLLCITYDDQRFCVRTKSWRLSKIEKLIIGVNVVCEINDDLIGNLG